MRLLPALLLVLCSLPLRAQTADEMQRDSMFYHRPLASWWVAPASMQAVKLDNLPNSEQIYGRTSPGGNIGIDIVMPVRRFRGRLAIRSGLQMGCNPYRIRMNLYRRPGNNLAADLQGTVVSNYRIVYFQAPLQMELRRKGGVNHYQVLRLGGMAVYALPGIYSIVRRELIASANSSGQLETTFLHSLGRPGYSVSGAVYASLGVYSRRKKNNILGVHLCARYMPVPLYKGYYQLFPMTTVAIESTTSLSGNYVGVELGYLLK